MRAVPFSAVLVAWGNAWLAGRVGVDEAADMVECAGGPQVVVGLPGEPDEVPLRRGLAVLRVQGMTGLRLALPAPGDPLGLPGPAPFNTAAIEAGEAVLMSLSDGPLGLVSAEDRRGSSYVGVRWTAYEAERATADTPALAEAEHALTLAVRDTTEMLLRLDVARWRPEIAETLSALRESHRHEPTGGLAPGYPPRAHRVAALAGRLAVITSLALEDEGGAVTAGEMVSRRVALRELDRAVRRARVAAYNCVHDHVR